MLSVKVSDRFCSKIEKKIVNFNLDFKSPELLLWKIYVKIKIAGLQQASHLAELERALQEANSSSAQFVQPHGQAAGEISSEYERIAGQRASDIVIYGSRQYESI